MSHQPGPTSLMRKPTRVRGVQKVGLFVLLAILGLSLVFALLPAGTPQRAQTGVRLQDVRLTLYPSRDPDAVWRFAAAEVSADPVAGTTQLQNISGGERLLRERAKSGEFTGREILDATIRTPDLRIDAQDNLTTSRADITLVKECADLALTGTPERPVTIEQGLGFSAPDARLDSPALRGQIYDLRMDFQFNVEQSSPRSSFGWNPDASETCRDGKRVPL